MPESRANVRDQMLAFECGYCGMPAGRWCVTKTGGRANYLHAERWWAWKNTQTENQQEGAT